MKRESKTTYFDCEELFLFLSGGGTTLWEIDPEDSNLPPEDLVSLYLEPNGIYGAVRDVRDKERNVLLFEVDHERTNLKVFYFWTELDKEDRETQVWRKFYWVSGKNEPWGWEERVKEISFGNFGNLKKVFELLG